ncbi:hypothetical protein ES708_13724 [subsurface metagenome]
MEKLELVFSREKQTRNTWRYKEDESEFEASVGTLYVRKEALGEPVPQRLRVTIEEDD